VRWNLGPDATRGLNAIPTDAFGRIVLFDCCVDNYFLFSARVLPTVNLWNVKRAIVLEVSSLHRTGKDIACS